MTIKTEDYNEFILLMLGAAICTPFILYSKFGTFNVPVILMISVVFVTVIGYWMATGRTIIMDQMGCTVVFGKYRKCYRWDELKVKQYVDCRKCLGYGRQPYQSGAEFSIKEVKRPKWMQLGAYCQYFHPLTYIYVYFRPRPENYPWIMKLNPPFCYPVDELEFRKKMIEWGVDMDIA